MSKLEDLTLTELKELAKKNNIKNISKLKKDELITVLKQVINFEDTKQDEVRMKRKKKNKIRLMIMKKMKISMKDNMMKMENLLLIIN